METTMPVLGDRYRYRNGDCHIIDTVQLFGTVNHVRTPQLDSGAFRFARGSIHLRGRVWISVADIAKSHPNNTRLTESQNAPWYRGRLQTLFEFQQSQNNLDCESWVDSQTYRDRMMLNTTFVAETIESKTPIQIPFICTEQFGEAALCHGVFSERNTERNQRIISSMSHAFVDLLLAADRVDDYDDHAITVGREFKFGVRNGNPYNTFLNSHP